MLTTLNQTTLQALRDNGARESVELDFKSEFNVEDAAHRRGLIDDVCALANARGGWLLLGVTENADGAIAGLPGIQFADADGFRLRVGQMIEGGLEPQLTGVRIECVPVDGGRWIAGIRVPQSWAGPHRTAGGRRFMVRADARNTEYDIHGLRQAFWGVTRQRMRGKPSGRTALHATTRAGCRYHSSQVRRRTFTCGRSAHRHPSTCWPPRLRSTLHPGGCWTRASAQPRRRGPQGP